MKRHFKTLRVLAVVAGLCLGCGVARADDYSAADLAAPAGDPTIFRITDPSYRPSAYTAPPPQMIERIPTPDPAAQYAAVAMPLPVVAAPCEQCPAPTHSWLKESTIYTRIDYFHW